MNPPYAAIGPGHDVALFSERPSLAARLLEGVGQRDERLEMLERAHQRGAMRPRASDGAVKMIAARLGRKLRAGFADVAAENGVALVVKPGLVVVGEDVLVGPLAVDELPHASSPHTFNAGMSIQRRSFQLLCAASTSCRPLAPSSSVHLNGASSYKMPDEHLPLGLEAVVVDAEAGHLLPGLEERDRLRHVGIPHRPRRVDPRLAPALLQAGDRRAVRAVDMERHQIVAPHPRAPGHVDMRDRRRP